MKLLIIGHSVVDHIFDGEEEKITAGGIYYSSIGFNSLKFEDDEFYLLTSISPIDYSLFEKMFANFNLQFANKLESIPHVNLYVDGTAERREHYSQFVRPLKLSGKISLQHFDGIYINMITGNDLSPEQFVKLRKEFLGKIYLDVHTLSRGIGRDQHRFFRKIPDYQIYLNSADIIQVNEHELKTLTPYDDKKQIINTVFEHGVQTLVVTLGEKGAEVYSNKGDYFSVCALKINTKNKVGCGDVFGSVFFYSYLSERNFKKALELANRAAGMVTSYSSEEQFLNLKNDII